MKNKINYKFSGFALIELIIVLVLLIVGLGAVTVIQRKMALLEKPAIEELAGLKKETAEQPEGEVETETPEGPPVTPEPSEPEISPPSPPQDLGEPIVIPSGLEPSEFCKAYVGLSFVTKVGINEQEIFFDLKNTGSVTILGLDIEIHGEALGETKKREDIPEEGMPVPYEERPPTQIKIAGIEASFREERFSVAGIIQNINFASQASQKISLPLEIVEARKITIDLVGAIPKADYNGVTIRCPDTKTWQSGGSYTFE